MIIFELILWEGVVIFCVSAVFKPDLPASRLLMLIISAGLFVAAANGANLTYSFSIASRRIMIFVSMSEPFKPHQATKCPINLKNPSNPFDPLHTNPSATLSWLHPNMLFILRFRISSQSLFAHSAGSSENMANGCSGPASAISFSINSTFSQSFCKISITCRQPHGSSDNNMSSSASGVVACSSCAVCGGRRLRPGIRIGSTGSAWIGVGDLT